MCSLSCCQLAQKPSSPTSSASLACIVKKTASLWIQSWIHRWKPLCQDGRPFENFSAVDLEMAVAWILGRSQVAPSSHTLNCHSNAGIGGWGKSDHVWESIMNRFSIFVNNFCFAQSILQVFIMILLYEEERGELQTHTHLGKCWCGIGPTYWPVIF